ncbi:MAG: methyltransferase domain-containing protein [Acidobacteria bacterium]|nr:methyltransferase domain-containing protein [Acidobacteriota bacterium]
MTNPATSVATVDRTALEAKVKEMYRQVAENPHGEFHFEMGRAMAERLGYAAADARLARQGGFAHITYRKAYIEETGLPDASVDCVISNGVINLAPDKGRVFQEAARLLRSGGRLAIADIVADVVLPDNVVCNPDLWAACIGGAAQRDLYREAIEQAGLRVEVVQENTGYQFISERARTATAKFGVKSVSILARKP